MINRLRIISTVIFCALILFKWDTAYSKMPVEEIYERASTYERFTGSVVDSIRRDPFYRVLDQPEWDLSMLTDYDIDDFRLLGVVWGVPRPVAMFSGPMDKKFILGVGDRIGRNNGEIIRISEGNVHIRETHRWFDGSSFRRSIIKSVGKR